MTLDIGRFQKAIALLKALGAHHMVIIHTLSMWQLGIKTPNSFYLGASTLWGVTTMMFPFFAGFYVRSELGPYLDKPQFSFQFVSRGLKFFCLASLIEAVRLLLLTFDFRYCLNLQVLQFIALSSILSYVLVGISEKLLPLVAGAFLLAQTQIQNWVSFLQIQSLPQDATGLAFISWGWSIYFLAIFFGSLYWILRSTKMGRSSLLWSLSVLAGAIFLWQAPGLVEQSPRALLSFVNIPHDLLAPNLHTDNYWHLIPFFPVFYFGYLTRSLAFRDWPRATWVGVLISLCLIAALYLISAHDSFAARIDSTYIYSKSLFAFKPVEILGFAGIFGVYLGISYFGFKYIRWYWLDRWLYYSRSALLIYVIHGFFIAVLMRIINLKEFFSGFEAIESRHLIFVVMFFGVYWTSLVSANLVLRLFSSRRLNGAW